MTRCTSFANWIIYLLSEINHADSKKNSEQESSVRVLFVYTHTLTVHTDKCAGLLNESENLSHRFDTL